MQRLDLRVGAGVLHAPFAGTILDAERAIPLVVRFDLSAITADGRLVSIDRPTEWPDQTFPSWTELKLQRMGADQMAAACCSGSLLQLQLRLNPAAIQPG